MDSCGDSSRPEGKDRKFVVIPRCGRGLAYRYSVSNEKFVRHLVERGERCRGITPKAQIREGECESIADSHWHRYDPRMQFLARGLSLGTLIVIVDERTIGYSRAPQDELKVRRSVRPAKTAQSNEIDFFGAVP